jgi:cbb3-type cytochrome oxidase subunit 3
MIDLVHWFEAHSILIMLAVFTGMGAWVYWPSRRRAMEHFARIPLEED